MPNIDIKQFLFHKGAARRVPISGTFELTSRCNLNCKMCYVHMTPDQQAMIGRELSTQQWISLGHEAVKEGMIYLLLTGGEPLLRPDFLEIYTELISMGLLITINTNATLLTPEIVECFENHPPERINVSLYGMTPCTYGELCENVAGFDKAIAGIRRLKEAGIQINLNTTFTRKNVGDMEKIVDFAKENQIPIRMAAFIFPPVRNERAAVDEEIYLTPEELGAASAKFDRLTMNDDQLNRRKKAIIKCLNSQPVEDDVLEDKVSSCMAGRGAFWISWDGKMYPCGMLPGYSEDVIRQGFAESWKRTCANINDILIPKECLQCGLRPLCAVCGAIMKSVWQEGECVPTIMCRRTKAYVDAFLSMDLKDFPGTDILEDQGASCC